jgi:tetratricopeptide (TPR) repeat protein
MHASRQVWAEQLPVLQIYGSERGRQVVLGGARFIGPGWSGSPMILPESSRLAGIFSRKDDLQLGDLVVQQNRLGGNVRALRELMKVNGLRLKDPPTRWKARDDAAEAFAAALNWLDSLAGRSLQEGVAAAEAFRQRRPRSARAHLFLAMSSTALFLSNPRDLSAADLAEQHYGEAVRLDPDSLLIHAAYGVHLEERRRPEEALAELAKAARIDSTSSFVQAARLKILADLKPQEAATSGRQLVSEFPDNAAYWFHYAGALRKLGRSDDAMRAAQTAVRLASKEQFWYRGRLADLLSKCGRLEEAEGCYRALIEHRPESPVFWSWYAQFLAEQQPKRTSDLRRALERCESLNHPPVVPQKLLDDLRAKLKAADRE